MTADPTAAAGFHLPQPVAADPAPAVGFHLPQAVAADPAPPVAGAGAGGGITQAGERRSAAIESLRALAALGVLEGHVFGSAVGYGAAAYATVTDRMLLGGGMGVFLFFALSGYLLYRPFARRDFAGGSPVRLRRYAANRAVRILPLYYVVLVVTVVVFDHGGTWSTWWRSTLFLENFFPSTLGHIDGVMWSLVVELQFYVLLPLLAAGLRRAAGGRLGRGIAAVVVLAGAAAVVRLVTVTTASDPSARWQYSLPEQALNQYYQ